MIYCPRNHETKPYQDPGFLDIWAWCDSCEKAYDLDDCAEDAECSVCARTMPVCCDSGFTRTPNGYEYNDPRCPDCCGPHTSTIWDGKTAGGGSYQRGE